MLLNTFKNIISAPFLYMGFRPFFFAAGLSSLLLMLLWLDMYQFNATILQTMSMQIWHAHEMIYAYLMAVVVGFLLTAIQNWTGQKTLNGAGLLLLFILWLAARLLPFVQGFPLLAQAIIDCSFLVFAFAAMVVPVVKSKSWRQIGILSKVLLMAVAHIVFFLGLLGVVEKGVQWGLYGAFYMVLALTFEMARRVVPFFIEKGLGGGVKVNNSVAIDRASLVLVPLYVVVEMFWPSNIIYAVAALLCISHSIRLVLWYQQGIWQKPLLWSLYIGYVFLTLGFALKAATYFTFISPFITLHCFAMGIALFTIGMMSRESLGHTGRAVSDPPKILFWMFALMVVMFIFRIVMPLIVPLQYVLWIGVSQVLWMLAFSICFYLCADVF
jgi:uncharacterized protein involved in response to NO